MKNSSFSFILGLLLVLALAPTLSFAQDPGAGPMSPPDALRLPIFKKLGLKKEQKAQIQQIQNTNQSDFEQKRNAMMAAKKDFDTAMDSNASDGEVRDKYQSFVRASDAFMNAGFEQALAVRKVLTLKQREKFRELKNKMMQQSSRQRQGPPPPPPPQEDEE